MTAFVVFCYPKQYLKPHLLYTCSISLVVTISIEAYTVNVSDKALIAQGSTKRNKVTLLLHRLNALLKPSLSSARHILHVLTLCTHTDPLSSYADLYSIPHTSDQPSLTHLSNSTTQKRHPIDIQPSQQRTYYPPTQWQRHSSASCFEWRIAYSRTAGNAASSASPNVARFVLRVVSWSAKSASRATTR